MESGRAGRAGIGPDASRGAARIVARGCVRAIAALSFAIGFGPGAGLAFAAEENSDIKFDTVHLTLEGAIQLGVTNATKVLKAINSDDSAAIQVLQAHARLLPSINLNAGYSTFWGQSYSFVTSLSRMDSNSTSLNYAISSSINVFNGLSDQNAINAAIARKKAANLSLARAKQLVAIDVEQSYLQVILDQRIEEIAQSTARVSEEILKLIGAQKRLGNAIEADLYRQKAQVASDRLNASRAADRVKIDRISLLQKLRSDLHNEYSLEDPNILLPASTTAIPPFEKLYEGAVTRRRDLQAVQQQLLAAQFETKAARGSLFPKFDLGASYGAFGLYVDRMVTNGTSIADKVSQRSIEDQILNQHVLTVGLTMSWAIYDRGLTSYAIQQARVQERNALLDKQDLENQVAVDIRQALYDYAGALSALESSSAGLEASQKAFEVIQERYKLGFATFIDLSLAQSTLAQAKAARAQSVIGYRLRKDVLAFSVSAEERY